MLIRFTDVVLSVFAIVIGLPFFLLLIVVMVLVQGLPVLFWQKRGGRNCEPFNMCKLRTMRNNTEDELGITRGLHDDRITPLGALLRKYKIDELPQFLNVLKGDMSVVGSRPQVMFYVEKDHGLYSQILKERPGLLSPAAIEFRDEEELLGMVPNPRQVYEEQLLPLKSQMDIDLATNLTYRKYLSVIIVYLVSVLFNKGRYSGKSLRL